MTDGNTAARVAGTSSNHRNRSSSIHPYPVDIDNSGERGSQDLLGSQPNSRLSSAAIRTLRDAILLCAASYISQRLAFSVQFPASQFATIWFPGGIILGGLLLAPPRHWWGQIAGAFVGLFIALLAELPIQLALIEPVMPLAYRVLVAAILRRLCSGTPKLDNLRHIASYLALAGVLAPGLFNIASAWLAVAAGWTVDFAAAWRLLLLADSVAHITLVPVLLSVAASRVARLNLVKLGRFTPAARRLRLAARCLAH